MEPEEKAEELVNKYRPFFYGKYSIPTKNKAKKCALIAVNEIIANETDDRGLKYPTNNIDYWEHVKLYISKL